jgi:protein TonB
VNRRDRNSDSVRLLRPSGGLWRRWGGLVIGVAVLAALVALVWHLLSDTASTKREAPSTPTLVLPPPPPPPPEPEKPPEPEPEKVKPEVVEPKPKDPVQPNEPPKDDAPPSPSKDLADPVSMNSDAQAGTDAFGVQAGRGGGMTGGAGGGLGSGSYARYISSVLQQALLKDPRTRSLSFNDIYLDIWLGPDGKTTQVRVVRTGGTPEIDAAVQAMVRDLDPVGERPPASLGFPIHVSMKGRRP